MSDTPKNERAARIKELVGDAVGAKAATPPPGPEPSSNGHDEETGESPPTPNDQGAGERVYSRSCPEIEIYNRQLCDVSDDALRAIDASNNNPPRLFNRGGALCRVRQATPTVSPAIEQMEQDSMRGLLTRVANWIKTVENESGTSTTEEFPPSGVVNDILSLPEWPNIPVLESITEVPIFDQAGRLVSTPGYNASSRLYYHRNLEIPEVTFNPTAGQVLAAKNLIEEMVFDFPFVDKASKAHAIAALLLLFVRRMVDGPTPLHLIDAPAEGTGKSLLIEAITTVPRGKPADPISESESADEWRKKIFSVLLEGSPDIWLDNLNRRLDSGSLAMALTSKTFKDRLLGFSRTVTVPNNAVWLATGNNVIMSRELIRRTIACRIDSKTETPAERTEFKHSNLLRWVGENRAQLIHACLTICQAWIAAGKPKGKKTLGKFESWAETIGGILDIAEIPGLMENAQKFRAVAADQAGEWKAFVAKWWETHGCQKVGIKELFDVATTNDLLDNVMGDKTPRSQRTRLGIAMGKQRDRVVNGLRIVACQEDNSDRQQYKLECVDSVAEKAANDEFVIKG